MQIPPGREFLRVQKALRRHRLHTVCQEARCPNRGECWGHGTATFMLLGDVCTRRCLFCGVRHGARGQEPAPPDPDEAVRIAAAVRELGLGYVVLTTVTRDDLPDGGAGHVAGVIAAARDLPGVRVEALIPDIPIEHLPLVAGSGLSVLAHNIEVVRRLTPLVRDPRADYDRSLRLLREAGRLQRGLLTKSSILLGLGESREEVIESMEDLRQSGVDLLTLGQYLRPGRANLSVTRYLDPGEWETLRADAEALGFRKVFAGPLVRSSYLAGEMP